MAGYGNAVMVYQMLLRNGVQPQAAMGALTSLMGESGSHLDPGSHNPNDPGAAGSVGMGQWNRERLDNLKSYASSRGTSYLDPTTQVGFIEHELQGRYSHVLDQLRKTNDLHTGASIWTRDYESPAVDNTGQRVAGNRKVVNSIGLGETGVDATPYTGSSGAVADAGFQPMGRGVSPELGEVPRSPEDALADTLASSVELSPRSSSAGLGGFAQGPDAVETATRAAAVMPATAAGVPAEQLSARYDQSKLNGGAMGQGQLADLFKVKDVGQARQIRATRKIA